jgi:hypothetical protein
MTEAQVQLPEPRSELRPQTYPPSSSGVTSLFPSSARAEQRYQPIRQ